MVITWFIAFCLKLNKEVKKCKYETSTLPVGVKAVMLPLAVINNRLLTDPFNFSLPSPTSHN